MTPFHYATESGLTNVLQTHHWKYWQQNPAASNGCTPLQLAAKNGHLEIVKLIVETGVDKNSLFDGKTALDLVRESNNTASLFVSKNNSPFYELLSKEVKTSFSYVFWFSKTWFVVSQSFLCCFHCVL